MRERLHVFHNLTVSNENETTKYSHYVSLFIVIQTTLVHSSTIGSESSKKLKSWRGLLLCNTSNL